MWVLSYKVLAGMLYKDIILGNGIIPTNLDDSDWTEGRIPIKEGITVRRVHFDLGGYGLYVKICKDGRVERRRFITTPGPISDEEFVSSNIEALASRLSFTCPIDAYGNSIQYRFPSWCGVMSSMIEYLKNIRREAEKNWDSIFTDIEQAENEVVYLTDIFRLGRKLNKICEEKGCGKVVCCPFKTPQHYNKVSKFLEGLEKLEIGTMLDLGIFNNEVKIRINSPGQIRTAVPR